MDDNRIDTSEENSRGTSEVLPPASSEPSDSSVPRFSTIGNVFAGLVLLSGILTFVWFAWTANPLELVESPDRGLELVVSRTMDLEEALSRSARWERMFFDLISGSVNERAEALAWYRELAATTGDPHVHMYLTVLEAEAGLLPQAKDRITSWEGASDPLPTFKRAIEVSYLGSALEPGEEMRLQAELAKELPAGWFYDRLAIKLAARAQNDAVLAATRLDSTGRSDELLDRARAFLGLDLAMFALGFVVLGYILARPRERWSMLEVANASIPPPWRGRVGVIVLIRGGAVGLVLLLSLFFLLEDGPLLRIVGLPLVSLPLFWLAQRHLLEPAGIGFREGFGLWPTATGWKRLVPTALALVALGTIGDLAISIGASALGRSIHWTEWFDAELAWGSWMGVGVTLLEFVVYAPVLEEIAFRGILFATLRRKFSFAPAAMIGALVFAVAHGYGWVGFLSVLWSGAVWAWGYEKTGSLLPGMLAHALNNLLVSGSVMLLLRSL